MAKATTGAMSAKNAAIELKGEDEPMSGAATMTKTKAGLPSGFKVKKLLTLPALVMKKVGEAHVLKFIGPIHTSDVEGRKLPDGTQEKPAQVAHVIDQETGETLNFLIPSVVMGNLQKGYPDDAYVGLTFYIENMGKRKEGQRYVDFSIAEVEAES